MSTSHNNTILVKTIIAVFVLLAFFSPISPSHTPATESQRLSFSDPSLLIAEAADSDAVKQKKDVTSSEEGTLSGWIANKIFERLGNALLSAASGITWIGGQLLEYVTNELVFKMSDWVGDGTSFGNAITNSWKVIRDICNLAFIFGFIYIGIRAILEPDSAPIKRTLTHIITGALLINFSLFIVKAVIDFSNFTAFQIFTAMTTGSGSISAKIADILGIVTFFSAPDPKVFQDISAGGSFWFFVLGAIFLLIAAFIFIAASILLIIRFVALVLIMVASPVLFAATVFPKTEHFASELWGKLFSYAFFAPIYFLFTLIALTLLDGFNIVNGSKNMVTALTPVKNGSTDTFGVILFFFVATSFLITSLTLAQKMGIKGGEFAIKWAGAATMGVAAKIGRSTVGRWANKMANDDTLRDRASTSWVARQKLKASSVVADSSFDARNLNLVSKNLGTKGGTKGGYVTKMKDVQKKEEETAKLLGEVGDNDVRVEARKKDWEAAQRTQKAETVQLREEMKRLVKTDLNYQRDRDRIQGDIDKLEKDTKDAQIEYEKEKQRRVIGSTYAKDERPEPTQRTVEVKAAAITTKKGELKVLWSDYATLSDPDKKTRRDEIEKRKEELSNLEKENRNYLNSLGDQGYAGALESSNEIKSWPNGRLVVQNKEAGKALRKTAEKGLPKKKDE